jgi:ribonucleoside-diphosphate reductase alpha chain
MLRLSPVSQFIWEAKYRFTPEGRPGETSIEDTWRRVAAAVAAAESDSDLWQSRFFDVLAGMHFLPGGRILAGAGTQREVTLYNCFVAGELNDTLEGILAGLRETAITLQQGGGVGCDFSPLRPAGSRTKRSGGMASGPVSFLQVWNALAEALQSASSRRGAMMATLRCDHPDIEAFIAAKLHAGTLSHFNLSVLVSDAFMDAVRRGAIWKLCSPASGAEGRASVVREVDARDLWRHIADAAHRSGEPGVLFIDRINRENNLQYCETISATNPCGEVPLPPYGACNLGSINLPSLVREPFTGQARFDKRKLQKTVATAVRFLDNVTDVSHFPLRQQQEQAWATRRIGLGITGLADLLAMLDLHYDSEAARRLAEEVMQQIRDVAYATSAEMAVEKGAFPQFEAASYLASPFVKRLPKSVQAAIARNGIRNSHMLAIAPAGSISLLADNVSSGIEPIFALSASRSIRGQDLRLHDHIVQDHAYRRWREVAGTASRLPESFVTAEQLPASAHLEMQSCLQPLVDGAISKTINLRPDASVENIQDLYSAAYAKGLKGCTVFRRGCLTGQVLQARNELQCCPLEDTAG